MRIVVNPRPGALYDLIVDGIVEMENESYEVVNAVRFALVGYRASSKEATEIADRIREKHSRS